MIALQCKMCKGSIRLTGETHGICEYCGTEVTLPKIDDDKRAEMYNRGNHFRSQGDFDKAYSAYEHIIADNQQDAEAHWCLVLCRYGIEYVKDAKSEEYKPTCNRMLFQPFLDDTDYLDALKYSDEYTKQIYRREAERIAYIQEKYLEISHKEEPYDVFICFKDKEEDGQRTVASVIAQDIYDHLTDKGLKVFFSRITLNEKIGKEFEPYIFAALHSAKVMLVVATKKEHLNARWVRNEWSRYLAMMENDRSKSIVPVFRDISPYDFPPEIPTLQGQDMSRVGVMQDLVRGVLQLTGKLTREKAEKKSGDQVTSGNLLKRVQQAVEDGAFDEAVSLAEQVLNIDAENGEAYFYLFLASHNVSSLDKLLQKEWNTLIK